MNVAAWIGSREPAPPAALAERLRVLAAEAPEGAPLPEAMIIASGNVLRRLLHEGQTGRAGALELLAADALATYAFEAQGEAPEELDARCTWAMGYLSRIAERP